MAILAAAGELSLPLKKTKLAHGQERPLFTNKLDEEWQKIYKDFKFKLKTAGAAIEALEQLLEIEREDAVA